MLTFEQRALHKHSFMNYDEIIKSKWCGCFYCCRMFHSERVKNYITERTLSQHIEGVTPKTALCPMCGTDSVIGDAGVTITLELLHEMRDAWFAESDNNDVLMSF